MRHFYRLLFGKKSADDSDRKSPNATRILFVCMANICRSPIAKAVATRMAKDKGLSAEFIFDSAGTFAGQTGQPADIRARQVAAKRGYLLDDHRARMVTSADFLRFDFVLAMDQDNVQALSKLCPPDLLHKVGLFMNAGGELSPAEVPDPYYGSIEGFERVFDLCETAVEGLLKNRLKYPG